MEGPINHCWSSMMHSDDWNEMRNRVEGKGTGNDLALKRAENFRKIAGSPVALKDACYYKVKAQYDVFPSAYASGAIAKCRKNKGKKKK